MTPAVTHPLVAAYLRDLELLLHGVDPGERAEVLAGVHEHLDASLPPGATDDDVRRVLAELGSPQSVADEAYAGRPAAAAPPVEPTRQRPSLWPPMMATALNAACLILLLLAWFGAGQPSAILLSFYFFVIPWVAICVLSGVAGAWTQREKLASALIVPGTVVALATVIAIMMAIVGPHMINLLPTAAILGVAVWILVKLVRSAHR